MTTTGKVHLNYDESTGLVELSFSAPGETSEEHDLMAEESKEFYDNLITKNPNAKFKILVDLTNAGIPTKHATEVYVKTLSDKRIVKTAFLGMSQSIESIINFIVSAAGRGDHVRFFIDRQEALEYLQS